MLALIETGKKEGATLKCGGDKITSSENGYFVQQTVFADVTDEMTIAKEEVREILKSFFFSELVIYFLFVTDITS